MFSLIIYNSCICVIGNEINDVAMKNMYNILVFIIYKRITHTCNIGRALPFQWDRDTYGGRMHLNT